MKSLFVLLFLLLAMLQAVVLLSTWTAYNNSTRTQSFKFWSTALAMSASAYIFFAVALTTSSDILNNNNFFITIANTLIFGSVVFQGLFARTLRDEISGKTIIALILLIAFYCAAFEFLRHFGSFISRTFIVGILIFLIYVWQLYEIIVTRRTNTARNLKALLIIIVLEALLIFARSILVITSNVGIQVLDQIPVSASVLIWVQLTLNITAYIIMVGYWIEDATTRGIRVDYENHKIRALLDEKEELLKNLIKTKKIAEMGAMSASIAHEINQPLAAIKLNAWSLKKTFDQGQTLSPLQNRLIDDSIKDIDRMAMIVKTLQSVFKNQKPDQKIILLADFLQTLKPLFQTDAASRALTLIINVNPETRILCDESEITLILLNLINNAIKAGAKTLRISTQNKDGMTYISVSDDGSGVSADMVPHLFEMIKSSGSSGLGLGLWLSKFIVERAGGTIHYMPVLPRGARFTFDVPAAP